ncbi:MAG: hypothetical protein UHW86_09690 [Spirochaetota bacterium]|nr:hypothetical protein [Spirochaetota bacterium]
MRIKELEFENINSLSGHWKIDFTDKIFDDFGRLFTIQDLPVPGKLRFSMRFVLRCMPELRDRRL